MIRFSVAAFAVFASVTAPLPAPAQDGGGLMRDGLELFFEGLRDELNPALGDLQDWVSEIGPGMADFLREMGPAMADILDEVQDWSRYEAPEILPNGDIIIRRKPDPVRPATPAEPQDI